VKNDNADKEKESKRDEEKFYIAMYEANPT
jgi:hypothetical protein